MKTRKCQYTPCSKEYYVSRYGHSKYCSPECKTLQRKFMNPTKAKVIDCKQCGSPFSRRCAKDVLCMFCKNKIAKDNEANKGREYPKLDRDIELKMQEDFLKKRRKVEKQERFS